MAQKTHKLSKKSGCKTKVVLVGGREVFKQRRLVIVKQMQRVWNRQAEVVGEKEVQIYLDLIDVRNMLKKAEKFFAEVESDSNVEIP